MTLQDAPKGADLATIAGTLRYRSARRYRWRSEHLFQGLPLRGARVLDVGCGPGAFTIWPALNDAAYVLGIEPEIDGATSGTLGTLMHIVADCGVADRVDARAARLEELSESDGPFDVVVTHNVINHLDEDAVRRLPGDSAASRRYSDVFAHIASLMAPGGVLIVADCARSNAWGKRGIATPLTRGIEWQKHLDPQDWLELLLGSGYELLDLRWSYLYPLRRITANRFVQYWTSSHFVLRVRLSNADGHKSSTPRPAAG